MYAPDDNALFALITTVMEKLQLNILSATINTTASGFALDTFHVLDSTNLPIDSDERIEQVRQYLIQELGTPQEIPEVASQRLSRQLRYFSVSTQIEFSDGESGFTDMRITAADRPGILSSLGEILMHARINVHAARISTLGERIDDVFSLSTQANAPLSDAEQKTLSDIIKSEI